MKIIKCLTEKIREELHDAEAYIDLANAWKEEDPEAADLFYDLSEEEMGHMEKLHGEVVKQIKAYREENGEPPKGMLALYNYMHDKQTEDAMMVKVKQAMYKD